MKGFLGRVFSTRKPKVSLDFLAPLQVARPTYYVGDIHGAYGSLTRLLEVMERDVARNDDVEVIFLGDYIDRGDQSREVLEMLYGFARSIPDAVTMLMGNHERMLLDFLADPDRNGRGWIMNGGLQTLASFGVGGLTETASPSSLKQAAQDLKDTMTEPLLNWIEGLPRYHENGNLAAVHAGANPARPLSLQSETSLLWGHPDFLRQPRNDETWIIHGHVTVQHPEVTNGRVAIDTGAWHSGILTAAYAEPDAPLRFLDSRGAK